jgi:hypothetical protein
MNQNQLLQKASLRLRQAKRLLEYRRRTSRAPRLDDDLITQTRLRRLIKVVRPNRFVRWLHRIFK